MFDTTKAKQEFATLDHKAKLQKVKEILELLSKKSALFAELHNHFKQQKDIQENALDAIYTVVIDIIDQQK